MLLDRPRTKKSFNADKFTIWKIYWLVLLWKIMQLCRECKELQKNITRMTFFLQVFRSKIALKLKNFFWAEIFWSQDGLRDDFHLSWCSQVRWTRSENFLFVKTFSKTKHRSSRADKTWFESDVNLAHEGFSWSLKFFKFQFIIIFKLIMFELSSFIDEF